MTFDEELAFRVQGLVETEDGLTTKRMFGGMAFLIGGHLTVAASSKGNLMARVAPEDHEALLAEPHVGPMIMGGRETKGWVRVEEPGYEAEADLQAWVARSVAYVRTLPPQ